MTDFDYKKYSLENLEKWIEDALSSAEASPQEIYDTIWKVVSENYYHHKHHASRANELMQKLTGLGKSQYESLIDYDFLNLQPNIDLCKDKENSLTCDKDDKSPECQKAWNDFWEENYYPEEYQKHSEETVDDGMRPWGHSDLEYGLANSVLTGDFLSNFPGEQYSEKVKVDGYSVDGKDHSEYFYEYDRNDPNRPNPFKVSKWILPVELDGLTGECYIQLPDDLLKIANLKEGDQVEWIDRKDGSFEMRKVNGTK